MGDISAKELRKRISEILKTADLSVLTSKTVREQLEKSLGCSLVNRKKQIDSILMEEINKKNGSGSEEENDKDKESEESEISEEEEEEKPKKKRAAAPRKAPAKKKRKSVNGTDTNSDSDDGSDEDYKQTKKPAAKKNKAGGPKKGTGFTRPYTLSPELSALMGADSLPRHAVVKKIWSIIKERNLYDPKNKQYAICDDQLMSVMKIKRFRTFGMLKYLKPHFID